MSHDLLQVGPGSPRMAIHIAQHKEVPLGTLAGESIRPYTSDDEAALVRRAAATRAAPRAGVDLVRHLADDDPDVAEVAAWAREARAA